MQPVSTEPGINYVCTFRFLADDGGSYDGRAGSRFKKGPVRFRLTRDCVLRNRTRGRPRPRSKQGWVE